MVFDDFFRQYYVPMVIFADRTLHDRHASENVVQDAFVKLWQQYDAKSRHGELKNYLFLMVRNRLIDELRRRKVEQRYIAEAADVASESVTDHVFEMELYEQLYAAIEQLPRKNAEVMRLKLMGMSNEDIADRLGIKYEPVHSHLRHGVAALRKKFDKNLLSLIFI